MVSDDEPVKLSRPPGESLNDPVSHSDAAHDSATTQHAPESALASSPILKDDNKSSPVPPLTDKLRASGVSSFRFSKDLDDIRWDGSSVREEDFPEEDEDDENNQDGDNTGSEDEGNNKNRSKAVVGTTSYSTLSKRAEFILANAKKKLNLLEGNLGRARHSLVSPSSLAEMRSASSLSSYATPGSSDEDEGRQSVKLLPRINFTPSRQARAAMAIANRSSSGHNRMFSDTSVPSPGGGAIKGSRSLDCVRNGDLTGKYRPRMTVERAGSPNLVPVIEDEQDAQPLSEKRESIIALREFYGATSPSSKSIKELRDAADELRNRIAFLQKRSQEDPAQYGFSASSADLAQSEEAFLRQVNALQQSLEDQEQLLEELENAERSATESQTDPRGEWHQVLDYNENRGSGSEFSDEDEEDESDKFSDEVPLPNLLDDGEDSPDETTAIAGAHEDREDAFDYEHFILHSAMGRYRRKGISRSPSTSSVDSSATAQGDGATGAPPNPQSSRQDNATWDQFQQPNESVRSLETTQSFATAAERGDTASESGSNNSDQHPEELLRSNNPWPMPPASVSSSQGTDGVKSQPTNDEEGEPLTPTASSSNKLMGEDKGIQHDSSLRPVSAIYEALLTREGKGEGGAMKVGDDDLIRSLIESFRGLCKDLNSSDKRASGDIQGLRDRLIVAKRVLDGEL